MTQEKQPADAEPEDVAETPAEPVEPDVTTTTATVEDEDGEADRDRGETPDGVRDRIEAEGSPG